MTRVDQPTPNPLITARDPRKAEDTDTRQGLQRHDPEFYKKKKDEGEQQGFKDPYEDLTDVSVSALRNFLLGLLDRAGDAPLNDTPDISSKPQEHIRPAANPKAAAAISAYQSGAARGISSPQPPPRPLAPEQKTQSTALDEAAASLDRAMLLDLIRDLDRLAAEGVSAIALEKGEGGFLASIRVAIDKARGA
ncbi:MAG: hypothetical protein KGQ41_08410 [Alphaproteobacteria bacterium]|nr:hypothetical protein [Alphaproteobacteria bacterium]